MSYLAKCFLWENCEAEVSYCSDWMVTEKCFQNMTEKGFENRETKEKCAEEDWYFEGKF
jgi:hypothetical protein